MGRLFITPREIDLISDWTKEIIKDVIGQKIFYYSVSETKSRIHDVYFEAPEKVFENPVEIDALVEWKPETFRTNNFGTELVSDIMAWVHARDLLDKGIELSEGDFFSYGEMFFEIVKYTTTDNIYGQIEHTVGYELYGQQARQTQFIAKIFGPTDESYSDTDAVQDTFVQQRGQAENRLGPTGDVRELQRRNILDAPLTGPKEVSPKGTDSRAGSAFYDDD
jgi:hypothetical protein